MNIIQDHPFLNPNTILSFLDLGFSKIKNSVLKDIVYGINQPGNFYNISSKHAEMDVIDKIKNKKISSENLDLFVIKITKDGEIKNSKPCKMCLKYIKKSNLKISNIYYSNSSGFLVKSNIKDLENENLCITTGMRNWKKKMS